MCLNHLLALRKKIWLKFSGHLNQGVLAWTSYFLYRMTHAWSTCLLYEDQKSFDVQFKIVSFEWELKHTQFGGQIWQTIFRLYVSCIRHLTWNYVVFQYTAIIIEGTFFSREVYVEKLHDSFTVSCCDQEWYFLTSYQKIFYTLVQQANCCQLVTVIVFSTLTFNGEQRHLGKAL